MNETNPQVDALLEDALAGVDLADGVGIREREVLPEGSVLCRVTNTFFNQSRKAKRPQLNMTVTILDHSAGEEFRGKTYTKTWGLDSKDGLDWLNTDISNLELPPLPTKESNETPTAYVARLKAALSAAAGALVGVAFAANLTPNTQPQYPPQMWINAGARRRDLETGTL